MATSRPPVTWLLEIHPDFTDPERLSGSVKHHALLDIDALRRRETPVIEGPLVAFGRFKCLTHLLRTPLAHAVLDDYKALQCREYFPSVYPFFRRNALLVPMNALQSMDVSRIFGERLFIRPDSNKKPFEAQVVEVAGLPDYLLKHAPFLQDWIVVSDVLDIRAEFRVFCRNGQAFTASQYMSDLLEPVPKAVISFAEEVAHSVENQSGMNMLTIDVAILADGGLALIEIGGVCSWGLYDADEKAFIEAMEAEAIERFEMLG